MNRVLAFVLVYAIAGLMSVGLGTRLLYRLFEHNHDARLFSVLALVLAVWSVGVFIGGKLDSGD